ncbi:crotonase/enoyl-CoA hydratase family protein [Oceaniserpentilla sp. 4NH20-0058]|uniref:crotonase/enoyl-CoA hydratase family protein n=1 Tax=Oceaniserpentilla sp. 4NH20-0058 TaxID=3127660 RepID=UPI003107FC9D
MDYQLKDDIAFINIDDGKANAMNHEFIDGMNAAFDKAEAEAKVIVIQGREGMLSAGFDLKAIAKGGDQAVQMLEKGMVLMTRMYSLPLPVITVCEGHAIGMGAFILMASDNRIGVDSEYVVNLPETAIGMPFTPVLMSLIKDRIVNTEQTIAVMQSKKYTPAEAVDAGFLDQLVPADKLLESATALAKQLAELPKAFYKKNKLDLRGDSLEVMRASLK